MLEQIAAMEFAVTRLCENKGKHKKQYKLMDEELGLSFVPVSLRKHVPVILKSRKGELVNLNR